MYCNESNKYTLENSSDYISHYLKNRHDLKCFAVAGSIDFHSIKKYKKSIAISNFINILGKARVCSAGI